jgi:hypothetical protein
MTEQITLIARVGNREARIKLPKSRVEIFAREYQNLGDEGGAHREVLLWVAEIFGAQNKQGQEGVREHLKDAKRALHSDGSLNEQSALADVVECLVGFAGRGQP